MPDWDVSAVTRMSGVNSTSGNFDGFVGQSLFNANISKWDTSSVTNMEWMFKDAWSFNHPIGEWDTSKVKSMKGMFSGASSFDPVYAICNFTVSGSRWLVHTGWNELRDSRWRQWVCRSDMLKISHKKDFVAPLEPR